MKQLESFYLDGSNTTDDGLSDLISARPDLHFHEFGRHHASDPRKDTHEH